MEIMPTDGDLRALVHMTKHVATQKNNRPTYTGFDFALRLLLSCDVKITPSHIKPWFEALALSDVPQSAGATLLRFAKRSSADCGALFAAWAVHPKAAELLKTGDVAAAWRVAIMAGVKFDVLPATMWSAALAFNPAVYDKVVAECKRHKAAGSAFMLTRVGGSYKRVYYGPTGTAMDATLTAILSEERLTVHSVGMLQAAAFCYREKWQHHRISVANRILTRLWKQVTPYMFAASSVWVTAAMWSALFGTAHLWHQHTESTSDCGYFQRGRGGATRTTLQRQMHRVEFNPLWSRRALVSCDTQRAYDYMANPAIVSGHVGERMLTVCIARCDLHLPSELIRLIALFAWHDHNPNASWPAHLKAHSRILAGPGVTHRL
jgi:hypothetical protein